MGEAASSILDGDQSSIPDRDQPETSSIPHSNLPAPMPDHASNLPAVIAPQRLAPRLGGQLLAKQLLAKDGKGLEATGVHGAVIAATRAAPMTSSARIVVALPLSSVLALLLRLVFAGLE